MAGLSRAQTPNCRLATRQTDRHKIFLCINLRRTDGRGNTLTASGRLDILRGPRPPPLTSRMTRMGSAAERSIIPYGQFELLREAREVMEDEAAGLTKVAATLDEEFCKGAELLCECRGSVIVTGMGKAGLIGRKIAATLASTGTRPDFLHPAEAAHGDLGCLLNDDVLLVLSNSGETKKGSAGFCLRSAALAFRSSRSRLTARARWEQRPLRQSKSDISAKPGSMPWRPQRAQQPCLPWATRSLWLSAAAAASPRSSLPFFTRGAAWARG